MLAWLRPGLPAWVATRLGLAGMSVFAAAFSEYILHRPTSPLHAWYQWDTGWYLRISEQGYFARESANFFPLFPSLVAGASALLLHPHAAADSDLRLGAALFLACALALPAYGAVARLATEVAPGLEEKTALALAAYPGAFFLAAAYTESLFVGLATLSLLLARRRRWAPAAACAALAGLTRSTALILVLPLAWEVVRHGRRPRDLGLAAGLALAPVAGLALYGAYLGFRFGDPLLFAHTQTAEWHHRLLAPWQTAALVGDHLLHRRAGLLPIDLTLWLAAVVALLAGARRLPLSYTLLAGGAVVYAVAAPVTNVNDVLISTERYLLAASPLFVVVAGWMRASRYFEAAYLVCGLMLQAGLLTTFLLGGPVL